MNCNIQFSRDIQEEKAIFQGEDTTETWEIEERVDISDDEDWEEYQGEIGTPQWVKYSDKSDRTDEASDGSYSLSETVYDYNYLDFYDKEEGDSGYRLLYRLMVDFAEYSGLYHIAHGRFSWKDVDSSLEGDGWTRGRTDARTSNKYSALLPIYINAGVAKDYGEAYYFTIEEL